MMLSMENASIKKIVTVRLGEHEATRLREIRLRALKDAPDSFYSTYESEHAYPVERWVDRVTDQEQAWFTATLDGVEAGLVGGFVEENGDGHLISLWVAPEARGQGVASLLVDRVIDWARERRVPRVILWAVDANSVARALYRGKGFLPTGKTMLIRDVVPESEYALSFA